MIVFIIEYSIATCYLLFAICFFQSAMQLLYLQNLSNCKIYQLAKLPDFLFFKSCKSGNLKVLQITNLIFKS